MKRQLFSFLVMVIVLFMACTTTTPTNSLEDSASIKIECRNENNLKQTVLQYLRSAKARDIGIDPAGDFLDIHAAFRLRDVSLYRVEDLKQDLQQLTGVVNVTIEINKVIVRESF